MDAAEQVRLAGKLGAALAAAELELVQYHQEGSRGSYRPAELVDAIGALVRHGFVLREVGAAEPPVRPPRLLVFRDGP